MKTLPESERHVCKLEVKYGDKIEPKVRPLIVALQAFNFPTSGSHEGQEESEPYPWVLFVTKRKSKKESSDRWEARTRRKISQLLGLLGEFYADREVPEDQRLNLEFGLEETPFVFYKLRPRGAKTLDLLPRELLTKKMRTSILKRHQEEMAQFTKFLHTKIKTS